MSKKKYSFYSPTPLSLALAAVFSGIYCNSGTVSAASYDVSGWEEIASHRTENDVHLNVTADLDGSYFKNKTKEIVIDQVKMTIDGQGHHVTFPERDIDEVLTATNGGNLTIRNLAIFWRKRVRLHKQFLPFDEHVKQFDHPGPHNHPEHPQHSSGQCPDDPVRLVGEHPRFSH